MSVLFEVLLGFSSSKYLAINFFFKVDNVEFEFFTALLNHSNTFKSMLNQRDK
jgi:hypothetical protein